MNQRRMVLASPFRRRPSSPPVVARRQPGRHSQRADAPAVAIAGPTPPAEAMSTADNSPMPWAANRLELASPIAWPRTAGRHDRHELGDHHQHVGTEQPAHPPQYACQPHRRAARQREQRQSRDEREPPEQAGRDAGAPIASAPPCRSGSLSDWPPAAPLPRSGHRRGPPRRALPVPRDDPERRQPGEPEQVAQPAVGQDDAQPRLIRSSASCPTGQPGMRRGTGAAPARCAANVAASSSSAVWAPVKATTTPPTAKPISCAACTVAVRRPIAAW